MLVIRDFVPIFGKSSLLLTGSNFLFGKRKVKNIKKKKVFVPNKLEFLKSVKKLTFPITSSNEFEAKFKAIFGHRKRKAKDTISKKPRHFKKGSKPLTPKKFYALAKKPSYLVLDTRN